MYAGLVLYLIYELDAIVSTSQMWKLILRKLINFPGVTRNWNLNFTLSDTELEFLTIMLQSLPLITYDMISGPIFAPDSFLTGS